jgi:hypothetical protein
MDAGFDLGGEMLVPSVFNTTLYRFPSLLDPKTGTHVVFRIDPHRVIQCNSTTSFFTGRNDGMDTNDISVLAPTKKREVLSW